jgi:hypothetical protein
MPPKISAPLSMLIFFYAIIIGLSCAVLGLSCIAAIDIKNYLDNDYEMNAMKKCKVYFNAEKYVEYEKCYKEVIKNRKNQK